MHTEREAGRQRKRDMEIHIKREADRRTDRRTEKERQGVTHIERGRQTDRWTEKERQKGDRQSEGRDRARGGRQTWSGGGGGGWASSFDVRRTFTHEVANAISC